MRLLRIALAQMNPTVGDLEGNATRMIAFIGDARERGADLVAFPELAITGYPPEDLLFKQQFIEEARVQVDRIVGASDGLAVVVGTPDLVDGPLYHHAAGPTPNQVVGKLFNAAAVANDGRLVHIYHKIFLPNYGVFDEERYFEQGSECPVFQIRGVNVGVNVCEDIWYDEGPTTVQRAAGAEIIVNINASPYHHNKGEEREAMLAKRASDHSAFIAYVNTVGGQDELVFDGQSMVFDPAGKLISRGPQFEDSLLLVDVDADEVPSPTVNGSGMELLSTTIGQPVHYYVSEQSPTPVAKPSIEHELCKPMDSLAEVYAALVTGTRDYVRKSGFNGALIGLSGGIDSALTTAIAASALGADQITCFFMPSQYTADQSMTDSEKLVANLGVRMVTLPIQPIYDTYLEELGPLFKRRDPDITEENLQARIRGNLLMAASNKFGSIVLTTGNKSEMAAGYATLYGDMAGGFAVIKDVPKTLVFDICKHLNATAGREVIPESIIVRPPTAELRPDQKDSDSLPAYEVLDPVLKAYVEDDWTVEQMLEAKMPADVVSQTIKLVDRSEYKRRQAPPGVKITRRNFGRDRRLPIVNRYRPGS